MPRNRAEQDREGKRAAIVDAAGRLFEQHGFERTSVAAIAAEAKITKNTVYWYFDDKDALLLAVLVRTYGAALEGWNEAPEALAERLEHVVHALAEIEPLTTTLHARLPESEALREWHAGFHSAGDRWLARQITGHLAAGASTALDPGTVDALVRLWSVTITGMVTDRLSPDERHATCALLVAQLDALAAAGLPHLGTARPGAGAAPGAIPGAAAQA